MELIKKNLHMECAKSNATLQFALENDLNLPEDMPDMEGIRLDRACVEIEEIHPGTDIVKVSGHVRYELLYQENTGCLERLEGKIAFDEKMRLQGVTSEDTVAVNGTVEDLTIAPVNSRKLCVKSLVTLSACARMLCDEEIPIGVMGEGKAEYRREPIDVAEIKVCKKDVFRIREEVTFPGNYGNIYRIIWTDLCACDMEFKVEDARLVATGDIRICVLYEVESKNRQVLKYETTIPYRGSIDCSECKEGMIPDVEYRLIQKNIEGKPDADGEERCLGIDALMECTLRIYEEGKCEMVADLYGVSGEINVTSHEAAVPKLVRRVSGKAKAEGKVKARYDNMLQLLHSEGQLYVDRQEIVEKGIELEGHIDVHVLYIAGEDASPYGYMKEQIPYTYSLEITDIDKKDLINVRGTIEQLQVTMSGGGELEVRALLDFESTVFRYLSVNLIDHLKEEPIDASKRKELPGFVIYTVKAGDNLWNIGRKYYMSVDDIRKVNNLADDNLAIGQKLLLVKM